MSFKEASISHSTKDGEHLSRRAFIQYRIDLDASLTDNPDMTSPATSCAQGKKKSIRDPYACVVQRWMPKELSPNETTESQVAKQNAMKEMFGLTNWRLQQV